MKNKTVKSLAVLMAGAVAAATFGGYGGMRQVEAAEEWVSDEELTGETEAPAKDEILPSESQLAYQRDGLAAFMHFGPNTFNEIEWGEHYGNDVNEIFRNMPDDFEFDADGYVKMIKDAGFKRLIITAKHHDGFCIWQSGYTDFDMGSLTKYKDGQGDILAEVSEACTKYDIDMGLYLSPWDIHEPSYGDSSEGDYNDFYVNQLTEILGSDKYGNAGEFVEVWMDGAKGSGSQYQTYDTDRWAETIAEVEGEDCLLMQCNEHTDVRWIGNENGYAADETWAQIRDRSDEPGYNNPANNQNYDDNITGGYSVGYPDGDMWVVPEADARITSGWFWGNNKKTPKSLENLIDMYMNSIGHNATYLLNIPPNTDGTVDDAIKARTLEFGTAVQNAFDENLADSELASAKAESVYGNDADYSPMNVLDGNDDTFWAPESGEGTSSLLVSFNEPTTFNVVSIEEAIQNGQRIESFTVEYRTGESDEWQSFGSGATIGSKRLVSGVEVTATDIKITVDSYNDKLPEISTVEVYAAGDLFGDKPVVLNGLTAIDNTEMEKSGNWTAETINDCHNSTSMYTSAANAAASFTFTGSRLFLYGTQDPNHGSARIIIDGTEAALINTHSSTRDTNALLYASDTLEYGEHTVTITVVGDGAVGLDAAGYLNNQGAGMLNFETTALTMEEDEVYTLGLYRVGGSSGRVDVTVNFEPGTAVQNFFDTEPQNVVFEDGETYKEVTVTTKRVDGTATGADKGDTNFTVTMDINSTEGAGKAIQGENSAVNVTIKDAERRHSDTTELKALIAATDVPNTGYTSDSYAALTAALEAAKAVQDDDGVDAILKAYNDLNAAYRNLVRAGGIELPVVVGETVTIEAETGAVENNTADDDGWPATVADFGWASGGKGVDAVKSLDTVSYYLDVQKAGRYEVTLSYRSGNPANSIVYTSDPVGNITAGSVSAGASSTAEGTKQAVFTLEIPTAGLVEWIIRGGAEEAPQMDKFDVRLVEVIAQEYTITASAGEHGSISPSGEVTVTEGENQTFAITPDAGYKVKDVKVDGVSVGAVTEYTFENVSADASIEAEFALEKYTEDNRFQFPAEVGASAALEAELASEIINDESNDNGWPCVVTDADWASGGQFVDAINAGDVVKYYYNAPVAGTYQVTVTYKSGSMANQLSWSSEPEGMIESGTVDAGASSTAGAPKTKEFEIVVTEAGEGTWVFTGPTGKSPQLDKFDITLKEAEEPENVSKTTLEYFLKSAKEHLANGDVDDCVQSIKDLFNEAITEGEAVMADEHASREEVMNATLKLVKAIHALEMKAADKTDLEMAVELGDMIDLSKYVEAGQKEFADALAAAKEVLADSDVLQGDVDNAWDALVTAMENLRLKADKDALEALLNEAAGLDLSRYTDESAAAFRTALASAQAVFADETLSEADQQTVDDAVAALSEAKSLLVEKTPETPDPEPEDPDKPGSGDADKPGSGSDGMQNSTNDNARNDAAQAVQTGDSANLIFWAVVLGAACAAGASVLIVRKKKSI